MYNTPPTYAIYVAGLVFQWLQKKGGLTGMEKINVAKAGLLYDLLDASGFYHSPVARDDRSRMNVPFTLSDAALDDAFLKQAAKVVWSAQGPVARWAECASLYGDAPGGVKALVGTCASSAIIARLRIEHG